MSRLDADWIDDELRILHDRALRFTEAEFSPQREAWRIDRRRGIDGRMVVLSKTMRYR